MVDRTPPNKQMQTIDLTNFQAGVVSSRQSLIGDVPRPDGAAQEAGTYGCYALPDGGLAPLPAIGFSETAGDPNLPDALGIYAWPTVANGYPADYDQRIAVLDAHVVAPVERVPDLGAAVDASTPAVDLFTCRQWYMASGIFTDALTPLVIHRFRGHPVYSGNTGNTYAFRDIYSIDVVGAPYMHPSRWKYGWGSIMETRTQAANDDDNTYPTTNIGPPVIVAGLGGLYSIAGLGGDDPDGLDDGVYISYPDYHVGTIVDPLDPTPVLSDTDYTIPQPFGVATPGVVFGHQGRLCAIQRKSGFKVRRRYAYHGGHDGFRAASELVAYWPVNGIYNNPNGPTFAVFLEEATTGYGTVHSVNANSLLLVKNVGGAVQVTGDLDRPTVTRLPGVPSVGGKANRGTMTDKGFAYGTTTGVWMWTGSDTATQLAPSLSPDFWIPDDPTIPRRELEQLVGSFAYSYPFLFAPNNWVMDLRTGGWFRYHPTPTQDPVTGAIFAFNEVDHEGNLWATVASYKLDGLFFAQFDQATACSKWSWQSQTLGKARSRYLNYRQITLLASGVGRVTVTVHSPEQGVADQQVQFDLTDGATELYTDSIGVTTTDLEVTITAEAATDGAPAPTVHRLSLGYYEAHSAQTGTP